MFADESLAVQSPDIARLTFLLGIGVAVWLYDRWHLTCGSIVTPAYLALNFNDLGALAVTILTSVATYGVVYGVIPRFIVLTGPTRFLMLMPVAILVSMTLHAGVGGTGSLSGDVFIGIGFIVPGLLAHDVATQGFRTTASTVLALSVGLAAIAQLVTGTAWVGTATSEDVRLAFDISSLPLAALLSVMASVVLSDRHGVRAGGFIGAAYLAMLSSTPFEVVSVLAVSWMTHTAVVRWVMPRAIVFGRRKFAAMLLTAGVLSWVWLLLRAAVPGIPPDPLANSGFALISMTIPGLLANDAERGGSRQLSLGLVLAVTFTLSGTWLAEALHSGSDAISVALNAAVFSAASIGIITLTPQQPIGRHRDQSRHSHALACTSQRRRS
ncbi:MAG: poly-gamma-glutamate biosynthesis protein PgsC/CapC [Planctomycetota bacterium]